MESNFSSKGLAVFFTGLSGAGKSTLADAVGKYLTEKTGRYVTYLDGDMIRKNLSSELGFSKEHRDLNVLRASFVAAEVVKHSGIVICSLVAPYQKMRRQMRKEVSKAGGFVEIYLSTPLEVCEKRDPKGLYKKVRAGQIQHFTGVDDPYETPENPELIINTASITVETSLEMIVSTISELGYIPEKVQV